MSDATVRADARTLPETTTRRAVLGAALAAGAIGATAVLPAAASQPQLSAVDRRVLDLWRRRARLRAALDRIGDQMDAVAATMPSWMQPGHRVEPCVENLWMEYRHQEEERVHELIVAFGALEARLKERKAEFDRTGYSRLAARSAGGWNAVMDVERAIEERARDCHLALAASLMINIQFNNDEQHVVRICRASLAAIRPQLVGAIAEDADRVLAQGDDEEDA